jgi:uncharacterized membrane protein YqgA involved in biofilm formation
VIIGPYINGGAVVIGALVGAVLSTRMPARLRSAMPLTFGAASMAMGVILINRAVHMPVMVLSAILGALVGELIYLEAGIGRVGGMARTVVEKVVPPSSSGELSQEAFLEKFVAIIVLFCASGTGIFGAMTEGMTGDPSSLIA